MRTLLALALASLALVGTARAEVDEKTERARTHLKAGVAYYDEGRYDDAAREMEAAYALKPLADLQYNLAQCYERLGRLADAAAAYEKYLAGKPGADDHSAVEQRVKNLRERLEQEKSGAAPSAPLPPPAEKVVFKTIVVYREAPPPPGRGARFAAYGLGVLTLGALASGITFTVLAKQNADTVTRNADPKNPPAFAGPSSAAQTSGQLDVIVAWVSYGVAALAAAGTIGLFVLGNKIDREAPKLTLAPAFSPTGGGLALSGVF